MTDFKPYLQSRTIWASIVGLSALGLELLGFPSLGDETQREILEAVLKVVELSGFVFGAYFRAVADKKLVLPGVLR